MELHLTTLEHSDTSSPTSSPNIQPLPSLFPSLFVSQFLFSPNIPHCPVIHSNAHWVYEVIWGKIGQTSCANTAESMSGNSMVTYRLARLVRGGFIITWFLSLWWQYLHTCWIWKCSSMHFCSHEFCSHEYSNQEMLLGISHFFETPVFPTSLCITPQIMKACQW